MSMSYAQLFWHVAGFLAPALVLAPAMVLASRALRLQPVRQQLGWWSQVGVNFAVCAAVLALGLFLLGQDGRMLTYALLVLASAACQALLTRG